MTHQTRPPNRLIHEVSPYLQQHAHNPVDWYPWGLEALERAKREEPPKPGAPSIRPPCLYGGLLSG